MSPELNIEIKEMPEETAKVILMLASNWNVSPDAAATRMLNETAERINAAMQENRPAA
jgi:hypothetical protein